MPSNGSGLFFMTANSIDFVKPAMVIGISLVSKNGNISLFAEMPFFGPATETRCCLQSEKTVCKVFSPITEI